MDRALLTCANVWSRSVICWQGAIRWHRQMWQTCSIKSCLRAYARVAAASGMKGMKGTISPKEKNVAHAQNGHPLFQIPFTRVAFGSSESPRQEAHRLTDFQRLLPPQRGNVQFRPDCVLVTVRVRRMNRCATADQNPYLRPVLFFV